MVTTAAPVDGNATFACKDPIDNPAASAVESAAASTTTEPWRCPIRGTARAPFFDKPATGQSYELVAMEWFEVRNGKIERRWGARDAASQARQLGWDVPATKADVE